MERAGLYESHKRSLSVENWGLVGGGCGCGRRLLSTMVMVL